MNGLKICQWEPNDSNEFSIPLKYLRSSGGFACDNADWADLPISWPIRRTVIFSLEILEKNSD